MNTTWIIGGLIGFIALVGGYVFLGSASNDAAMQEDEALMMQKDAIMQKESDAVMKDDASTMETDNGGAMMQTEDAMMGKKGSYSDYAPEKLALAEEGKVVLYFHAPWCPICRPLDAELRANPEKITSGIHILKVDYDSATSLKQKYGVTYQHTFVQVDLKGVLIAKWSDTTTLSGILSKVE